MSLGSKRRRQPAVGRTARTIAVAVAMAVLATTCADDGPVVTARGLEYVDGHLLDVYAPADDDRVPVVVVLHGAGVERRHYEAFAERLAEAGAVVFNVDWDVLPRNFEDASEQIACAVRFARMRASEFGGDPDRIVLLGHSSAAPWATRAALVGDEYGGACASGETAVPDALALLAPSSVPGGWPWEHSLLPLRPDLDVVVVHGADDSVVGASVGRRTAALLREAGHQVRLDLVPGGHFDLVLVSRGVSGDTALMGGAADRAIAAVLDVFGE